MKRSVTFVSLAFFLAVPIVLRAQTEAGTWKLNAAKSKYSGVATPKSRTQTWESQDGGVKHQTEGVAGDGSSFSYSFSAKYDGTDNPVTGKGAPDDADSVALKRVDARTTEMIWKKGGKVVGTSRNTVSKDGKVMTINAHGTNPDGTKNNVHAVYEKQ